MTPQDDPRAWLRGWVAGAAGCSETAFDDRTPLFDGGLLDSTDFVELLLAIEEASGRPLDVAALEPARYRSIDALLQSFFPETADAPSHA